MSSDPMNVARDREKSLLVGQAEIRGATVLFSMSGPDGLEFATLPESGMLVLGLTMSVRGKIRFSTHSFAVASIEIDDASSAEPGAYRHQDRDEDYHKRIKAAASTLVRAAFDSMAAASPDALPDALLEKLDDMALDHMEALDSYAVRLAEATAYKDIRVWEDMLSDKRRHLDGIDEAGSGHAYPFTSMSGYMVTLDGRPLAKPTGWGRNPEGWVGRLLHRRHSIAARMVSEIGNPQARIDRVRIVAGDLYFVRKIGFVDVDWKVGDEVRTFRPESQSASS